MYNIAHHNITSIHKGKPKVTSSQLIYHQQSNVQGREEGAEKGSQAPESMYNLPAPSRPLGSELTGVSICPSTASGRSAVAVDPSTPPLASSGETAHACLPSSDRRSHPRSQLQGGQFWGMRWPSVGALGLCSGSGITRTSLGSCMIAASSAWGVPQTASPFQHAPCPFTQTYLAAVPGSVDRRKSLQQS